MEGLTIRLGTPDDAETIARHRCEMFKEMGTLSDAGYAELEPASIQYLRVALADGSYIAWLVCDGRTVVAGGGMIVSPVMPRPGPDQGMLPLGPQGLIVNVFVKPEWRRRGIAEELVRRMIGFARSSAIPSVCRHASPAGRPIYERLGFNPTAKMRLFI